MIKIVLLNLLAFFGLVHLSIIGVAFFAPIYFLWRFYSG